MNILLTGATGFVGQHLISKLQRENISYVIADRNMLSHACNIVDSNNNNQKSNTLKKVLSGCDTVIHLAARAHVMNDSTANPLEEFRKSNVEMTRHLAEIAASVGVVRFVFVSSIKVNGEESNKPYSEMDIPKPEDDYGVSKWEAEQVLHEISSKTGMEIVIIRPPLVYGAGVKGNFAIMIKMLAKFFPLPLASAKNLRSFIYVENLVDALILCAKHPSAAGQTYLVSDGEDISTPNLIKRLSKIMGQNVLVFPCPLFLLLLVAKLLGKENQIRRLVSNLQIDSSKILKELNWKPPHTLQEGLIKSISLETDN